MKVTKAVSTFGKNTLLAAIALALAFPPVDAVAQSQSALEEIVVTARKREESLQQTPIAVTVFSSEDLGALQVDNLSQISEATPGMQFDAGAAIAGSPVASSIFIRGIGQTDFTLVTDPGVGVYLDGIYIARSVGGVLDLLDFDQVEVLRGPQGTLFGKNTIGGAINISTLLPENEFGGYAEIKTGTDDRLDVRASVDIPFTEWLSGKFSISDLNQDGYVKNLVTGDELSDRNATSGRFMLVAEPLEALSIQLSGDYTRRHENSQAQRLIAVNPASGVPTFAVAGPAFAAGNYACGIIGSSALDCDTPYVTSQGQDPSSDLDLWGLALTAEYEFEAFSVKSITGYRRFDTRFSRDSDNSPFVVVETIDEMDHKQVSQEFQVGGDAFADRLKWLLGFYYFQEDGFNLNIVPLSVFAINSGGGIDNDQIAVFGQGTYELTEQWSLTFGARYTEETKRFQPDPQTISYNDFTRLALVNANGELTLGGPAAIPDAFGNPLVDGGPLLPNRGMEFTETFDDFSLLGSVDYKFNDDLLVYLAYSEGFKSGGFNQRVFPPRPAPVPFGPEQLSVVEGGWKWTGLEDRVRLNGSAYFSWYDDIQVTALVGIGPSTQNAAEGEIAGVELELSVLPFPNFRLDANLAYTDAEFTKVEPEALAAGFVNEDSQFVNTPEWSWYIAPSYTLDVGPGSFTLRGDFSWRDEVYNNAINSEAIRQDSLLLVNALLSFETSDGHWLATLGGRNLTDEIYIITGNDEINSLGYTEAVFARDREWSLSLSYRF